MQIPTNRFTSHRRLCIIENVSIIHKKCCDQLKSMELLAMEFLFTKRRKFFFGSLHVFFHAEVLLFFSSKTALGIERLCGKSLSEEDNEGCDIAEKSHRFISLLKTSKGKENSMKRQIRWLPLRKEQWKGFNGEIHNCRSTKKNVCGCERMKVFLLHLFHFLNFLFGTKRLYGAVRKWNRISWNGTQKNLKVAWHGHEWHLKRREKD